MNTTTATTKIFTVAAIAFAAIAAAAFGIVAERASNGTATAEAQKIVKLERVVIEGKRVQTTIAQLPRVVIEGRRSVDTQVASAATVCATTAAVC